jgi:hypothetical protein
MKPDTLTPKEIFSPNRRLLVPLFQRPYVWNQEDQWEPLWTDIVSVAERHAQGDVVKPHFLGAMVLEAIETNTGDEVDKRLVIDGQQRMTTLQIALEALCDLCAELKQDKHHKLLLKVTRNDEEACNEEDERFKLWPTTVDQDHFRRVMTCRSPEELKTAYGKELEAARIGQTLGDCYLYFHEVIKEWIGQGDGSFEKRVEALSLTMRDKLRLVVIDLKEEDDAQVIFETLNARGTPLLPADLVKNFLFHLARTEKQKIEPLYEKYWKPFDVDDAYWRKEFGRGHTARARIDWFLQNYLSARKQDEVATSHLYTAFRDFSMKNGTATDQLANLRRYAQVYRSFDEQPEGSRAAIFFERVRAMDILSAYPCILELVATQGGNQSEIDSVMEDIESFLVRRMVCGLNTRGYNRLFIDVLKQIPGDGNVSARVRAFLSAFTADSNRWPDDDEFGKAWVVKPIYDMLVQARVRMLLEGLEQRLRHGKTEAITFQKKLQIEHLLPREWQEHWPLPEGVPAEEARERREQLLHTIGNLTMLTEKLNPSVSNSAWTNKRKAILEHSALCLNRSLDETWSEQTIRQRSENLFKVAVTIWPHPGKAAV